MGLMWISDLSLTNPHHLKLSEKVHAAWDLAESNNQPFSIMNCVDIARSHWAKVRETMLTMGPGSGRGTKTTTIPKPNQPKNKKKRKKKKGSDTPADGVAAAATKGATLPPQAPKVTLKPYTPHT